MDAKNTVVAKEVVAKKVVAKKTVEEEKNRKKIEKITKMIVDNFKEEFKKGMVNSKTIKKLKEPDVRALILKTFQYVFDGLHAVENDNTASTTRKKKRNKHIIELDHINIELALLEMYRELDHLEENENDDVTIA
jgi:hypothetical protein